MHFPCHVVTYLRAAICEGVIKVGRMTKEADIIRKGLSEHDGSSREKTACGRAVWSNDTG